MRLRRRFGRICRTCKLLPPPRPLPPTRTPPATRAWPCCRRSRPGAAAPHPHTSTGRNSRARDRAEETRPRTKSTARGVAALRPRRPRARLRCIGVLRAPSPAPANLRGDALLWSDRRFPPLPASLDALLFYLHRPYRRYVKAQTITKSSAVKPRTITKEGDFKPNIETTWYFLPPHSLRGFDGRGSGPPLGGRHLY